MFYDDNITRIIFHGNRKTTNNEESYYNLNEFEKERLIIAIIYQKLNIIKSDSDLIQEKYISSSPFYRVSRSYFLFHRENKNNENNNPGNLLNFLKLIKNDELDNAYFTHIVHNNQIMAENISSGKIFIEDVEKIKSMWKIKVKNVSNRAAIKGRKFLARNNVASGTDMSQKHYIHDNSFNNIEYAKFLINTWHEKNDMSSWFRLVTELTKTYKELYEDNAKIFTYGPYPSKLYGQFNYFFQLDLEYDDSIFENDFYASVIIRKCEISDPAKNIKLKAKCCQGLHRFSIINIRPEEEVKNRFKNFIFISLEMVHSTPVLILPVVNCFQDNIIPVKNNDGKKSYFWSDTKIIKTDSYETDESKATHLIMIDLEPYRLYSKITYEEE
jgi:hypothetical protein